MKKMYKCCSHCCVDSLPIRKITLLLVGLDNAGKTTTAKTLAGESLDTVAPTVGFSSVTLKYRKYMVTIYDLGGGPRIRGIWHNYFADVHGIIFVVDASDVARLDECRKVLGSLLQHKQLAGKPMLLLANKQDNENAVDEMELVERLELEKLVNQQRCPTRVENCSANCNSQGGSDGCRRGGKWRRVDPGIRQGFRWLVGTVIGDFPAISQRVEVDTQAQKALREAQREARIERVRRAREEREESAEGGAVEGEEVDGNGDPFRPMHEIKANLEKKEKITKEDSSLMIQVHASPANNAEHLVGIISDGGLEETILTSSPSKVEENGLVSSNLSKLIQQQLELEATKPKKRTLLKKLNKTAPMPDPEGFPESPKKLLPPLQTKPIGAVAAPWMKPPLGSGEERPPTAQSLTHNWGLAEDLEVVDMAAKKT